MYLRYKFEFNKMSFYYQLAYYSKLKCIFLNIMLADWGASTCSKCSCFLRHITPPIWPVDKPRNRNLNIRPILLLICFILANQWTVENIIFDIIFHLKFHAVLSSIKWWINKYLPLIWIRFDSLRIYNLFRTINHLLTSIM